MIYLILIIVCVGLAVKQQWVPMGIVIGLVVLAHFIKFTIQRLKETKDLPREKEKQALP